MPSLTAPETNPVATVIAPALLRLRAANPDTPTELAAAMRDLADLLDGADIANPPTPDPAPAA